MQLKIRGPYVTQAPVRFFLPHYDKNWDIDCKPAMFLTFLMCVASHYLFNNTGLTLISLQLTPSVLRLSAV
jgi:hypothetical protein